MIVGAGRSGTSSLLRYLGAHPALRPQTTPELVWFSDPSGGSATSDDGDGIDGDPAVLVPRYWDVAATDPMLRLGKAAGLMYEPEGLARLQASSPAAHLTVILREPVQRTYSGFWFGRARGLEPLESFEAAVWADPSRFESSPAGRTLAYLDWSLYAKHLSNLFDRFGRDAVHAVFFEEFVDDPRAYVAPVIEALGLDPSALPSAPARENVAIRARVPQAARLRKRKSGIRQLVPARLRRAVRSAYLRVNEAPATLPAMDPTVETKLRDWFRQPNDDLSQLLGRPLPAGWTTS